MIYIFLSHDVDWRRSGPPVSHVLARKERFDEDVLKDCYSRNLYYNFPEYMEIEEKFHVRSTFFFRTYVKDSANPPPAYHVEEYKAEIKSLLRGGWEIGLHLDPASYNSIDMIRREKKALETVAGVPVYGNRVHYTMNNETLHKNLQELSFKYDSSAKFNRERVVDDDFGYFRSEKLIIFPVTIMDALVFTYLAENEQAVIDLIKNTINRCREFPQQKRIITIIWHDCVLKMRKGRLYPQVLECLTSTRDVETRRGIDLFDMIQKGTI